MMEIYEARFYYIAYESLKSATQTSQNYLHQVTFIELTFKFNENLHAEISKDLNCFNTFYQILAGQALYFWKGGL